MSDTSGTSLPLESRSNMESSKAVTTFVPPGMCYPDQPDKRQCEMQHSEVIETFGSSIEGRRSYDDRGDIRRGSAKSVSRRTSSTGTNSTPLKSEEPECYRGHLESIVATAMLGIPILDLLVDPSFVIGDLVMTKNDKRTRAVGQTRVPTALWVGPYEISGEEGGKYRLRNYRKRGRELKKLFSSKHLMHYEHYIKMPTILKMPEYVPTPKPSTSSNEFDSVGAQGNAQVSHGLLTLQDGSDTSSKYEPAGATASTSMKHESTATYVQSFREHVFGSNLIKQGPRDSFVHEHERVNDNTHTVDIESENLLADCTKFPESKSEILSCVSGCDDPDIPIARPDDTLRDTLVAVEHGVDQSHNVEGPLLHTSVEYVAPSCDGMCDVKTEPFVKLEPGTPESANYAYHVENVLVPLIGTLIAKSESHFEQKPFFIEDNKDNLLPRHGITLEELTTCSAMVGNSDTGSGIKSEAFVDDEDILNPARERTKVVTSFMVKDDAGQSSGDCMDTTLCSTFPVSESCAELRQVRAELNVISGPVRPESDTHTSIYEEINQTSENHQSRASVETTENSEPLVTAETIQSESDDVFHNDNIFLSGVEDLPSHFTEANLGSEQPFSVKDVTNDLPVKLESTLKRKICYDGEGGQCLPYPALKTDYGCPFGIRQPKNCCLGSKQGQQFSVPHSCPSIEADSYSTAYDGSNNASAHNKPVGQLKTIMNRNHEQDMGHHSLSSNNTKQEECTVSEMHSGPNLLCKDSSRRNEVHWDALASQSHEVSRSLSHITNKRASKTLETLRGDVEADSCPKSIEDYLYCRMIDRTGFILENHLGTESRRFITEKDADCRARNFFFCISCKECGKRYVSYTTKSLVERLSGHFKTIEKNETSFGEHFNMPDHRGIESLVIHVLEYMQDEGNREKANVWMKKLNP